MSQAFTFSFNENIDDDDDHNALEGSQSNPPHKDSLKRETMKMADSQLEQPKLHSLQETLSSLPSTISYNTSSISAPNDAINVRVPRRELFDIRAQLMAEDPSMDMEGNAASASIAGLTTTDDIMPGVYEGGFKTWECAVDLAGYLAGRWDAMTEEVGKAGLHVIELGAGTALPTLTILQVLLASPNPVSPFHLTLADYNPAVLHLATIPNLLLTHTLHTIHSRPSSFTFQSISTHNLEINSVLLTDFKHDLARRAIHISSISGTWGPAFAKLVNSLVATNHIPEESCSSSPPPPPPPLPPSETPQPETLILASETIYSPSSLHAFTDTLFALLEARGGTARALVAAKKVYFGVGGGVEEFLGEVHRRRGVGEVVWESGGGVGRVILEVRRL